MTSRREKLQAMLAEEPDDVFLQYSLAMELIKEGNTADGLDRLDDLTHRDPPYVPAFFMAAQHLVAAGDVVAARRYLRNGIDQARAQDDGHAAGEMSEYLASLGTEPDVDSR